MTSQNVEIAKRAYEAYGTGDVETALADFDDSNATSAFVSECRQRQLAGASIASGCCPSGNEGVAPGRTHDRRRLDDGGIAVRHNERRDHLLVAPFRKGP